MYRKFLLLSLPICLITLTACAAEPIAVRTGIVQLVDRADLSAEDNGLLQQLNVKVGDRVKAGDVVAVLKDDEAKLLMRQAELQWRHAALEADSDVEFQRATAVSQFHEVDWLRAKEAATRSPGAFSLTELDKRKLEFENSKLDMIAAREKRDLLKATAEIKKQAADLAKVMLERRRIRSPIDGVVERIDIHPGEWVQAGAKLMLVVNSDRLRVQGLIAVADFDPDLEGGKASLTFDHPQLRNRKIAGVVSFVSRENEPRTNDIRVWIDFDNSQNLVRPGMQAKVAIYRKAAN